jgi:hypothetical protein
VRGEKKTLFGKERKFGGILVRHGGGVRERSIPQFLSHRSSLIMAEIEIFLIIDETEISFLSIPRSDIERLAVSPF